MEKPTNRRAFLKVAGGAGAGLVLGVALGDPPDAAPDASPAIVSAPDPAAPGDAAFAPNAFLRVEGDGTVTVTVPKSEMGQGIRTTVAMLVAEELDADWRTVRVAQAPADTARYGAQGTGGSQSVRSVYLPMRQAGATARAMLVLAAANRWGVAPDSIRTEAGAALHPPTSRRLAYGDLTAAAAALPVPASNTVRLKDAADFRLLGTPVRRMDGPDIVRGAAGYGLDVRLPGMRFAAVARIPVLGGRVAGYDEAAARAVPGVVAVVPLDGGIAVAGETTWAALRGVEALRPTFADGPNGTANSDDLRQRLRSRAREAVPPAPANAATQIEAAYDLPYLAHATMEPMNCTADVRPDRCELWVPTQVPAAAQAAAAQITGLPARAVTVNVTLLGGGFGRRSETDFVREAVAVSKAIAAPVQLLWTRADDMRHDKYRPMSSHLLRAGLDATGRPVSLFHRIAVANNGLFGGRPEPEPYDIPDASFDAANLDSPVYTMPWRSVYLSQNVFASESFMDELARAAGKDPYAYRRDLLRVPRLRAVLDRVAREANWDAPMPSGGNGVRQGRGIACMQAYGSFVATVAEVSVAPDGTVRVPRLVVAADVGQILNASGLAAQLEGAAVDGFATALRAEITVRNGRVQQTSFRDYGWAKMGDAPRVEVHLLPSAEAPGGAGELGYPSVAPAIANAVFAATGVRVRHQPIRPEDVR